MAGPPSVRALTGFALGMGAAALALLLGDARALRRLPALTADGPGADADAAVRVIIPARNEERNIAAAVEGVLGQTHRRWTLLVLDDHSADATGRIVAAIAGREPRLSLLRGADLPAGWTGKCWACWQAASHPGDPADWLLFLDADTRPQPAMLARSLAYAERHGLDLLTMMPFVELGTFWERAIMPAFFSIIQAAYPIERVNTPGSGVVLANGQFILVRRAAYERAGGHAAVRDRVLEDVELAQAVARAGGRMRAVNGAELLRVRMYTNGAEVREGLTKNAIAGLRNGGARSTWAGVRQALVAFVPPGLLLGAAWANLRRWPAPARWLVSAAALAVDGVAAWSWAAFMRRLYRLPARTAALFPLGMLCYFLIAADAAWRIWRGKGVTWKGRRYQG